MSSSPPKNQKAVNDKILVLGSTGQVGRALGILLPGRATFLSRAEADFSHPESLEKIIQNHRPLAIINTAAYTKVRQAEDEEKLATLINGQAPGIIAEACASLKIPFIHLSTDYVFGNSSAGNEPPWRETATPNPLNAYGRSKLEGEKRILSSQSQALILRTSWVFAATGENFLNSMLKLGRARSAINVVDDQIGAPTYAADLAASIVKILDHILEKKSSVRGIYHLTNSGSVSWYSFAERIFALATKREKFALRELIAVSSQEFDPQMVRPADSRLNCEKIATDFGIKLRNWGEALESCLQEKYHQGTS